MRWPPFLRPQPNVPFTIGSLALLYLAYSAIRAAADALDAVRLVRDYGPGVIAFFDTLPGSIVLLVVAIVGIAASNRWYGGSFTHPVSRGEKARIQSRDERHAQQFRQLAFHDDRMNIVPLIEQKRVNWEGLKHIGDPYIFFSFPVINATVRALEKGELRRDGRIRIDAQELQPPTVTLSSTTNRSHVLHGETARLDIHQPITPEMKTYLVGKADQNVEIRFADLDLHVQARLLHREEDEEDVEWVITLVANGRWNDQWREQLPPANHMTD